MLPISKLSDEYVKEALKHLQKDKYVIIIPGSEGFGKKILANELEKQLKECSFTTHHFNVANEFRRGSLAFYSHIIETISESTFTLQDADEFIQKLSQCAITQKTVLIFDYMAKLTDDSFDSFYKNFLDATQFFY